MAREKIIRIGALNITAHPHSPDIYVDLLRDAFDLKHSVRLRGDDYGIIGWLRLINSDKATDGVCGEIYKYFNLDHDRPWLNIQENKKLEIDDIVDMLIPDHIKPNLSTFRFIFIPDGHRLFFEYYSDKNRIGITMVANLFSRLLSHESIKDKYGDIEVVVEPSREKLEEILNIYSLKSLEVRVSKPNPDDLHEYEQKIL